MALHLTEQSPCGENSISLRDEELPMFSFPPSNRYPLNKSEDKESYLNQYSSKEHFDTEAQHTDLNSFDCEASSFSAKESVSPPVSYEMQSYTTTEQKVRY